MPVFLAMSDLDLLNHILVKQIACSPQNNLHMYNLFDHRSSNSRDQKLSCVNFSKTERIINLQMITLCL